jgi:peptidoglycan/xylan/chitin deacetylase (PgdA/CDA1 family)
MKYLQDNGYHVIPLADFVAFMEMKRQVPEKSVVITIDDGWKSFYDYGYPVLKKFGYPSTLFVYTDFPESDAMALSWQQVKELSSNGVDIQCHTKTHRNLKMQKGEEMAEYLKALEQEFGVCKQVMKEKVGVTPRFLAYPYGANNHLVMAMARKAGFQAAFTVQRGSNPFFYSDLLIRRSMIYGGHTEKDFENNLRVSDDRLLK